MKQHRLLFAVVVLATSTMALAAPPATPTGFLNPCKEPIPGEYIVGLKDGTFSPLGAAFSALPTIAAVASEVGQVHGANVFATYDRVFPGFAVSIPDGQARGLLRDPRVKFVEQSCRIHLSAITQGSPGWALDRVDEVFRPTDNSYQYSESGAGIHIYVLDSGIASNSEFNDYLGYSRLLNGTDLVSGGNGKTDGCGHGTAVASDAAGLTYGVAKGAYLHPVRMADNSCNSGGTANAVSGINWVINNNNNDAASVLNISWYYSLTGNDITSLESAISSALSDGITVVVSANNQGGDACNGSPARMSQSSYVITVGGTTSSDTRWSSSNYGSCVTLWAPGQNVPYLNVVGGSNYGSGTSFSSPLAAGAAALFLQGNTSWATPYVVKNTLIANATPVEIDSTVSGSEKLLMAKPANACFTWSCSSKTCTFNRTCSRMPNSNGTYRWEFGDGTGTTTTATSVVHTYPNFDIYTAQLTARATYAQWDTDTGCVNVSGVGLIGCTSSGDSD